MQALPKILLVADTPKWAFANLQQSLIDQLSDRYDFYTDFLIYNFKRPPRRPLARLAHYKQIMSNRASIRKLPQGQVYDIVVYLGWYFPLRGEFDYSARKIIKGIYDDGFPPQCTPTSDGHLSMDAFVGKYLFDADAVACGSRLIYERYAPACRRCYYAMGPSDPHLFQRATPVRLNEGTRFVVGWTGNPKRAFKGFYDFVVPAVEAARHRRPGIELKTRFSGPLESLPRFYEDVDVVLIASNGDAGPALFDEACGCEVPCVSTRIGIPYEVIEHGRNGLFVERDVGEMADALVHLHDHRDVLFSMARRIRADWLKTAHRRTAAWIHMFDSVLAESP